MKYYIVDAFTDRLFKGNPAGVCILDRELSFETMLKIAFENNLSETAFLLKKDNTYGLRWFTPEIEMDLCGHATLATAFVALNYLNPSMNEISFETQSGTLTVKRGDGGIYTMDFPSRMPVPVETPASLEEALGCMVCETLKSRDLVAVTDCEDTVSKLSPNIELLKKLSSDMAFNVIVTAPGVGCDFVSRFYTPNSVIVEDPVTGSAHSTLIPFWSGRLGRKTMLAKQLSQRGGTLFCEDAGERVKIGGKAVCYLQGDLLI